MLNNDILKYTLSTLSMRDIVRFSAISKQIQKQVLSLPYNYNVKSSDVFAIAMHKMHNKRFLNPALRKHYINRAIMEHNYALIREFASVRKIMYNELFDIAVGNSPDKLQIIRFYRNKWNLTRLIKNEDYVVIQNAYFIIKHKLNKVMYSSKTKQDNARLLCANCTNAEIRASHIFNSNEMKTALFEYANRELYYELNEFYVDTNATYTFNRPIIDDTVIFRKYSIIGKPNNRILEYLKNSQNQEEEHIHEFIPNYISYILSAGYNISNINRICNCVSKLGEALVENFELVALIELCKIDESYVEYYKKLLKLMR
jgi:hypothetical protein